MLQLLTILLYLNLISAPSTYQSTQINGIVTANQRQIQQVESDSSLETQIFTNFQQEASTIIIVDGGEGH